MNIYIFFFSVKGFQWCPHSILCHTIKCLYKCVMCLSFLYQKRGLYFYFSPTKLQLILLEVSVLPNNFNSVQIYSPEWQCCLNSIVLLCSTEEKSHAGFFEWSLLLSYCYKNIIVFFFVYFFIFLFLFSFDLFL